MPVAVWFQLIVTHGWDSPNYRATAHGLSHSSRATAAVVASSLSDVSPYESGRPGLRSAYLRALIVDES